MVRWWYQSVRRSKSELYFLSKKSLDQALWATMSQEYTELVELVSVARMALVANTFPRVCARFRMTGSPVAVRMLLVVMRPKA